MHDLSSTCFFLSPIGYTLGSPCLFFCSNVEAYFTNRSLQMLKFCAEDQLDDAPRSDPPRKIMWYWF